MARTSTTVIASVDQFMHKPALNNVSLHVGASTPLTVGLTVGLAAVLVLCFLTPDITFSGIIIY